MNILLLLAVALTIAVEADDPVVATTPYYNLRGDVGICTEKSRKAIVDVLFMQNRDLDPEIRERLINFHVILLDLSIRHIGITEHEDLCRTAVAWDTLEEEP